MMARTYKYRGKDIEALDRADLKQALRACMDALAKSRELARAASKIDELFGGRNRSDSFDFGDTFRDFFGR